MKKIVPGLLLTFSLAVFCSLSYAQSNYFSQNRFEFSAIWGTYSPSEKIKSAYQVGILDPFNNITIYSDAGKYGGFGGSMRIFFHIKNSPVKIGGEIGAFTMREEKENAGPFVWEDTGEPVTTMRYLNANHLQLMTDLYFFSIGKLIFHSQFGLGLLIYWDTDLGFGKAPFGPASEFMGSGQIVLSVPVKNGNSIDLQYGIIKGFSDNELITHQIHLGFSLIWNKKKE